MRFFRYAIYGWITCPAVLLLLFAAPSGEWSHLLGDLFAGWLLVLFQGIPIILPVGLTTGILGVLAHWFLDSKERSNARRYLTIIIVSALAGLIILPSWTALQEWAAVAPASSLVSSILGVKVKEIKHEQSEEGTEIKSYLKARPGVREGGCLFGRDFYASDAGDVEYIRLLQSLKQLHQLQRCIENCEGPLLGFPAVFVFSLWAMDRRRVKVTNG
jgi:hypothetical protein